MNIVDGKGTIHTINSTGKYTVCRTLIREHWQPTDLSIGCPSCVAGRRPLRKPEPAIAPEVAGMLDQLGCRIVDELLVIQVVPDVSGAVVTVRRSDLREWCKRRIESRKSHVGKALRGNGGTRSNWSDGPRATYKV